MKASLRNKVLILSLAALVVAGSGCERRGRVPKEKAKIEATGEKQTAVDPAKAGDPAKTVTTPTRVIETSNEETQLIADAQLGDCKASIDVAATSTVESFVTDLTSMNKLRDCLEKHGVKIDQETMTIEASPDRDPTDPSKNSALLNEYDAITTSKDSNEDIAAKVVKSRLKVLELNSKKMLDKYSDSRLKSETEYTLYNKVHTVGGTLANFAKVATACEEASKLVDSYATVQDGVNQTQIIKSDEASEEASEE